MDESTEWTPTERALFVAFVPLLAMAAVLLLVTVATSGNHQASPAPAKVDMSVSAVRERARKEALEERREMYYDCLKSMGVNVRGFASQFSRPSRETIRVAAGVCSAVMQNDSGLAPPTPRHSPVPNTL